MNPNELARLFHETYERLAPQFNYVTRLESRKSWDEVAHTPNGRLMLEVCAVVLNTLTRGHGGGIEYININNDGVYVLSPARPRSDHEANQRLLDSDLSQHKGQWIAVRDGKLLGAADERLALAQRLREDGKLEGALFVYISGDTT